MRPHIDKKDKKSFEFAKVEDLENWRNSGKETYNLLCPFPTFPLNLIHQHNCMLDGYDRLNYSDIGDDEWNFVSANDQKVYNHLRKINIKLEDVTERIFQGLKTGADKVFIVDKVREAESHYEVYSHQTNCEFLLEKGLLHPLIKGGNSREYLFSNSDLLIIFPFKQYTGEKTTLIQESKLKEKFPKTYSYLKMQRALLLKRDAGKIKTNNWYGYSRNQALDVISTPKIFTPDIAPKASYAIDMSGEVGFMFADQQGCYFSR